MNEANNSRDSLERNIERLLSRTSPRATMPDAAKDRILSALLAETADRSSASRTVGTSAVRARLRPTAWLTVAAAAAVLVIVFLWPSGIENGVTWADVTRHLESVETLIADSTVDEIMPDGARTTVFSRVYLKNPDRSRIEEYTTPRGDEIRSITIMIFARHEASVVVLNPKEKKATVFHRSFPGNALDAWPGRPRNVVDEMWAGMQGIKADQTRRIAERDVNGAAAAGFEADVNVLANMAGLGAEGTVRVWVAAGTGAPVELEMDVVGPHGERSVSRVENIQWNVHVPSAMFETPDLDGWEIGEF